MAANVGHAGYQELLQFVQYVENSTIFKRVARGREPRLHHPTSNKFDPSKWNNALKDDTKKNRRDYELSIAALWFALELTKVRAALPSIFKGMSQTSSVEMLCAMVNREFTVLQAKAFPRRKKRTGGEPPHLEFVTHRTFLTREGGQNLTPDEVLSSAVDTLPHWLFHALQLPAGPECVPDKEISRVAGITMAHMSLEHALRNLWQRTLWEGWKLDEKNGEFLFTGNHKSIEELWIAWEVRQQSLVLQGSFVSGALQFGQQSQRSSLLKKSIVGIETRPGRKKAPLIGRPRRKLGRSAVQVASFEAIMSSYLASYIDTPLRTLIGQSVTCRDLYLAWCVLDDLASIMLARLPNSRLTSRSDMRSYALPVRRTTLASVLRKCLEVNSARVEAIIALLSAQPEEMGNLFRQGIWSTPLIPSPNGRDYYMIAPVLQNGNPVWRMEAWLELGGVFENLESKGREFERRIPPLLSNELSGNDVLTDFDCPCRDLPTEEDGEEIDALVRLGNTLLVIEAKCFASPKESIDRFTYLQKASKACRQCRRKVNWTQKNLDEICLRFGWPEPNATQYKVYGAVVTNQGYGMGLSEEEVPVIDLHYLTLLLGTPYYVSDTAINVSDGALASTTQWLYNSQSELESKLHDLMADPIPLRRFKGAIGWSCEWIGNTEGHRLGMMMARLKKSPLASPDSKWLAGLVK